jgi:hypothetical protein
MGIAWSRFPALKDLEVGRFKVGVFGTEKSRRVGHDLAMRGIPSKNGGQ